jgi:hypothetical protein
VSEFGGMSLAKLLNEPSAAVDKRSRHRGRSCPCGNPAIARVDCCGLWIQGGDFNFSFARLWPTPYLQNWR